MVKEKDVVKANFSVLVTMCFKILWGGVFENPSDDSLALN
jgi:hypothetical protein